MRILYKSSHFDGLCVLLGIKTHVEEQEQNGSDGENVVSGGSGKYSDLDYYNILSFTIRKWAS